MQTLNKKQGSQLPKLSRRKYLPRSILSLLMKKLKMFRKLLRLSKVKRM